MARTLLTGALLVDGTGARPRVADVLIEDTRVLAIGRELSTEGADVIDLRGLVLTPGFIDIHTHYDAQLFWDPDLTPSSWHGVTTVVVTNCGFGLAPMPHAHRDVMLETLANVEGMSPAALQAGVTWNFTTFPELLEAIRQLPKRLNVAVMLGHTPLRMFAMGDAAWAREAAPAEIDTLRRLAAEAVEAGAAGFTTTNSPQHVGAFGRPVPSRYASAEEVFALADVLRGANRGVMQGTLGPEMTVETFDLLACRTGRPILWSAILAKRDEPDYAPGLLDRFTAAGAHAIPQIACKPIVTQISLREPSTLGNIPAFQAALSVPASDRRELYRDRSWRLAMKREARELWGDRLERAIVRECSNAAELVNGSPLDEATPAGTDPLDYLLDVAIADDLATRFEITMINDDEDQIGALLRDERLVLSLSDAGAHASQLCDADYATHLLARWWRDREVLPLEQAIWRLTGHPASLFGFTDRGVVRPGCVADLVAFDPGSVAGGTLERVYDFPGGADRLVARSQGVRATWVAGELTRWEGALVEGAYPGALLRGTASGVR